MAGALIGAGAGLLGAKMQSDAANKAAGKAARRGKKLEDRQIALFDDLKRTYDEAVRNGEFDPSTEIEQARADVGRMDKIERSNAAGAARIAGYAPGDSEPQRVQEAIGAKNQRAFSSMATGIRQNAFNRRFSALRSIDPSSLNAGIQSAANQQQMALSQRPNVAGAFASLMPFLASMKPGPAYRTTPPFNPNSPAITVPALSVGRIATGFSS